MIHKITGFAAERCGLYDRGVIAEGKAPSSWHIPKPLAHPLPVFWRIR